MKEHLCWSAAGVGAVINTEAEEVPAAVFRAVHTASDLKVAGPIGTRFQDLRPEHYTSLSQEALLEEFVRPDAPYRRMAIFGRSGSGKSHLIHWLKLQIPSTKERLVVVVPKAGTSLRSILEMLIKELPPAKQSLSRESLNRTGEAIATRKGQKERLLNEIAYALGEAEPSKDSPDQELERELIKVLPYLFQDIHFCAQHFYQEGNIISELVDHVFAAPSTYRPVEQRADLHCRGPAGRSAGLQGRRGAGCRSATSMFCGCRRPSPCSTGSSKVGGDLGMGMGCVEPASSGRSSYSQSVARGSEATAVAIDRGRRSGNCAPSSAPARCASG